MIQSKLRLSMVISLPMIILATLARADDVGALVTRLQADQKEFGHLNAQMADLTSQNERDLKERTLYFDNFNQQEQRKQALIAEFRKDADRRLKTANDMVKDWNSRCSENQVGKLSKPAYDACVSSRAQSEPVVQGIRDGVKRDAEAYHKKHILPIIDIQNRQKQGMMVIDGRIKNRFKQWEQLKARSDGIRTEMVRIRTALVDKCKTASTPESLRHCHSVGWDGARQDLPPLTNILPPSRVTPNQ